MRLALLMLQLKLLQSGLDTDAQRKILAHFNGYYKIPSEAKIKAMIEDLRRASL